MTTALDRDAPNPVLPPILAGPILRRLTPNRMALWLATSRPLSLEAQLFSRGDNEPFFSIRLGENCAKTIQVGEHAYILLIDLRPPEPLPEDIELEYDLILQEGGGQRGLTELLPHLVYKGRARPTFVVKSRLGLIAHGSCRKPHYESEDALLRLDEQLARSANDPSQRPDLLIMSGDQIYADDVAGPMLNAIHQAIALLGLYPERIPEGLAGDSASLFDHEFCYYRRGELLPRTKGNQQLVGLLFGGARKPIFTADTADNHLITLAEVVAMYLLVWSPALWSAIHLDASTVSDAHRTRFRTEAPWIEAFAQGLDRVQRALAHLPVYMIFDDHDVTDDWNLTRGWEESAYGHPFSRRILGNALIGYWLCQGWGNNPDAFDAAFLAGVDDFFQEPGSQKQDALIDQVLAFQEWRYQLPTSPPVRVLDTRTRRWRSETDPGQPSGLMDWEALSDFQRGILDEEAVLVVSPAPIFGVKLVEGIQKVFTYFGYALLVDAENWMAHQGSANVILNILGHSRTPKKFVILSGDVHYSFVYDVVLRARSAHKEGLQVWQITCSGFKNEFPHGLLRVCDRLDRWLYGARSPLNWFTKRRRMRVRSRQPSGLEPFRMANCSSLGLVRLDAEGAPTRISVLPAVGGEILLPEEE